jgi:ribosomal protein S18 acetylase RimI-like enzyme
MVPGPQEVGTPVQTAGGRELEIRKYHKGDFDTYVDLLLLTSQNEYSGHGRRDISRMLELMDKDWIWVAEVDKMAVGFVTVRPEKGTVHLVWLDVHPDHQRKGLGSALLETVIRAGKDLGLGPMVAEVWDGNGPAMGFYAKHGFKRKEWFVNYFTNGLNAWQLVKDI